MMRAWSSALRVMAVVGDRILNGIKPPAIIRQAALRTAADAPEADTKSSSPHFPRCDDDPAGSPPPLTPPGAPTWAELAEPGIRAVLSRHTPFVLSDGSIGCRPSWFSGDRYWSRHDDWRAWRQFIATQIVDHLEAVSLGGGIR